ncbi:MAG: hypothetical protein JWO06_337 [Bacteroidota bacterium]|nr:hypothetical protein [Bacteroidota bacterium]
MFSGINFNKVVSYFIVLFGTLLTLKASAQDSTVHELHEVIVTGFKEEKGLETSTNITSISSADMRLKGAYNISAGLATLPGISQLTTGLAISKPVIRGLYGNRLLTLISGLRFDNQQWQDEHGLGLSDIGVDRVEVIKGPLSILYGSDAVGGILNVIEENPSPDGKIILDLNTTVHSNTLGTATDIGIKGNRDNKWWRVRAGFESEGDYSQGGKYSSPDSARVRDSRSDAYYVKATYGFVKGNWKSENNYDGSLNDFGFMLPDVIATLPNDARWSRSLKGPHHSVIFNILSSQNTITLKSSILKFNVGIQSNSRREDEGGGKISLNMLLTTGLYNLQWIKALSDKVEMIISNSSSFENNVNFGSRVIIPDAYIFETAASGFFKFHLGKVIIETGAGINEKWIKSLLTVGVNTPDRSIQPFSKNWITGNGMLGLTYNPTDHFNVKLNAATGFRAPNLAELASNGLHEGIFHYELGDPNMKTEQNINVDLSLNYTDPWFGVSVSAYNNKFFNYIYLQPINRDFYGFPWYDYMQQDADLYGSEAEIEFTPQDKARGFSLAGNFATIIGKTKDGHYLPYIPATKIGGTVRYEHDIKRVVKQAFVSLGFNYVFAQNSPAPLETPTPAYHLLNASIGAKFVLKRTVLNVSVTGNNLLNAKYYDHLSRFKNYGIYDIGRDIVLNVGIPISFNYLTKTNKNQNQ